MNPKLFRADGASFWLPIAFVILATIFPASAQRQMEHLGRGMMVLRTSSTQTYIGWRLLGNDPDGVGFNLYRAANAGPPVKLNAAPLTNTTDYVDTPGSGLSSITYTYSVRPVLNGVEVPDTYANPLGQSAFDLPVNATIRQYFPVAMQPTPDGAHKVKFCWVGDLDGDGEYDYVVDRYNPAADTRQFLDAYKRDGTFLWRMDMGYNSTNHYNIEPGSSTIGLGHGDNVTVFDLDGDGKAEVIVRTANGVVFADGSVLTGAPSNNTQYISIIDGLTGVEKARAIVPNPFLSDGPFNGHMGIFYPDGVRPSVLLAGKNRRADNGFQGLVTVWDYRNGQLTQRWSWNDQSYHAPEGHQIRFGDVNHDGKDEFVDIGYALKDTGTPLFNISEANHGDRFHLTDIDPDHAGLETFLIQQDNGSGLATELIEAGTGKSIKKWYAGGVVDVGRGVVGDFSPGTKGCEMFSTMGNTYDAQGNALYTSRPFPPEGIWWDGDLLREFCATVGSTSESPAIEKFSNSNPANKDRVYTFYNDAGGCYWAYGGRPQFWGDLFGDWREEVVVAANDNSELRIYTTKTPAGQRIYTLMHNGQYRDQATTKGYVQASYVDYYLGTGMEPSVPAPYSGAALVWRGGGANTWDTGSTANWFTNNLWVSNTTPVVFNGESVLFDLTGSNHTAINLTGSLTPAEVTVYSPKNFTYGGDGSLDGAMKLTKAGAGKLIFSGTNNYTGVTLITEGPLVVNGMLPNSPVTVRGGVWLDGRIGGNGSVGGPVMLRPGAGLSAGQGTNSPATLTISNHLTLLGLTLNDFDLSDDSTGTVKTNDRVIVTGNVTLQGTNTFVIRKLNATLPPGVYPLISYSGTLSGGINNLRVSGLDGLPVAFTNPPGVIALVVKSTRPAATITWTGGSGGNVWDIVTSSNWLNGVAKDVFVPYDTVRFDNTGSSNLTVNLTGSLIVSNLIVDSTANYILSGSGAIIGTGSLVKSNTGTLTINTLNNNYTGPTIIAGGTVVVPEMDAIGFPSPLGNQPNASPTNLVLSGGATLRVTGESYLDRGITLNTGTNSLDVASGANQLTVAGTIVGTGTLQKLGTATLALSANNTYSGGTFIQSGTVNLLGSSGNQNGLGSGQVTFGGGTLSYMDLQSSLTYGHNFSVPTNTTGRINCDGRCSLTGSLVGGGTFTVMTPFIRTEFKGNWSAFNGQLNLTTDGDGGDFRINNTYGYANASVNLANLVSAYHLNGSGVAFGALSGTIGSALNGTPWTVGAKNTDATFAGNINGNSITKVGTGTWTLTGTNNYSGPTIVSAGTLRINNPDVVGTGSGALTVAIAGTLAGNGIIGGPATINGRLAPGSSIGMLTFSNNLTLTASSSTLMEISKSPLANDLAKVTMTLTYGGTLIVTNVGGALTNGDSFKLFDAVAYAGAFNNFNLPQLAGGLAWDTSALNTSGMLSIIGQTNVVPPAAPSGLIATAMSASQINLTWADNSTNENNFLIERSLDSTNFTQVIAAAAGVTNTADAGLAASTLYYYRVRASNGSGNSAFANLASATTFSIPAGLIWRGDGTANVWDAGVSTNWLSGGSPVAFADGASVIFDDAGSNNVAVSLSGALQPASILVSAAKNYTLGGSGSLAGSGGLMKTGAGGLTLSTINNTFTGGIVISNGTVFGGSIAANGSAWGTGPITFKGGTLQFNGYGGNVGTGWGGCTNPLVVPEGESGTLLLPPRWGYSAPFTSPLTGGGTLNMTVDYIRIYFSGNWSAFTGQINVSPRSGTGDFRIDNSYGYPNAGIFLNAGASLYRINGANQTIDVGELGGAAGSTVGSGNSASLNPTWRIGAKNTTSAFAGVIADSGITSLIKVGTGTLILAGANTYSGFTTISNGTLQIGDGGTNGICGTNNIVNHGLLAFNRADAVSDAGIISGSGGLAQIGDGILTLNKVHTYTGTTTIESGTLALAGNSSIAGSINIHLLADALLDVSGHAGGSLTLAGGQTLSGSGTVKGNFIVGSNGKLAPGNSIGTLTFSNTLTLSAGSSTTMEISTVPVANDRVVVNGNLIRGGLLVVTNISPGALAPGDTFPLFAATGLSGAFSGLALPALGANLAWDTNSFLATGTLTVVSTLPPAFGPVSTLNDGNFRMIFSGPVGRDYEVRASTNLMLQPVTLWELLASGTFGTDPVIFDDVFATNHPQRFYRLVVP